MYLKVGLSQGSLLITKLEFFIKADFQGLVFYKLALCSFLYNEGSFFF